MRLKIFAKHNSLDKLKPEIKQMFLNNRDEELEKLLVEFQRFDLSNSDQLFLWMYQGWLHFRRGDTAKARSFARKILDKTAHGYFAGKAHHLRGLCKREESFEHADSQPDVARTIFDEWEIAASLLFEHPERLTVISSCARLLADLGEIDEAIELIESTITEATAKSPELGWLYAGLGEIFIFDTNDWDRGKLSLEKAIELINSSSIEHGWVYALLAMGYNLESQFDKALPLAKRAVELTSKDPMAQVIAKYRAHYNYAIALEWLNLDLGDAREHYHKALELAEDQSQYQADIYRRLGILYCSMQKYALALEAFDKALGLEPDYVESFYFYWHMWLSTVELELWDRASDCFNKCLAWANGTSEECNVYYQQGVILRKLGRSGDAKDAFRQSLKSMPLYDRRRKKIFAFLENGGNTSRS